MSSDLFGKPPTGRPSSEADRSLIERVAQRLNSQTTATSAEHAAAHARHVAPGATPPQVASASRGAETAAHATSIAAAPSALERRPTPTLQLDFARLAAAGFVTPNHESSQLGEEIRIIKRPLLLKAFPDGGPPSHNSNLIMVTSAQPDEGKTFIALNLALSLALERNIHVLLIDTDFQNPTVQGHLGFTAKRGLIDVLLDPSLDVADVMHRTNIGNLVIIAAGTPHPHATELLASARMAELLGEIAHRYPDRVVMFDSPPLLAASAPSVLALHVGQIVFVVEADSTSRRAVDEALTFVAECPSVSIVLNKRQHWPGSKQFGGYYGYGSYGSSSDADRDPAASR